MPIPIQQIVSPATFVHTNASHINSVVLSLLNRDWRSSTHRSLRVGGAIFEYALARLSDKLCAAHHRQVAERAN